jgi:LysR family positive regulator for ilvC
MEPIPWGSIPMILPVRDLARTRVDAWFRKKGARPLVYAEVSGNEAILAMVGLGCGMGVVPELVRGDGSTEERGDRVSADPPLEPYRVGLCALKKKPLVAAGQGFWDLSAGE